MGLFRWWSLFASIIGLTACASDYDWDAFEPSHVDPNLYWAQYERQNTLYGSEAEEAAVGPKAYDEETRRENTANLARH